MQMCKVDVFLAGDRNHVVANKLVSVAEIRVLQFIHGGEDSVVNIRPLEMDKRSNAQEMARLRQIYRNKGKLLEELFGKIPKLPVNLSDIGVDHPVVEEARAKNGKAPSKKAPAKKAAEPQPPEGDGAGAGDGSPSLAEMAGQAVTDEKGA